MKKPTREVKILMRLPDGRNVAAAKPFTGAHLALELR